MIKTKVIYFLLSGLLLIFTQLAVAGSDDEKERIGTVEGEITFDESVPQGEVYLHLAPEGVKPFYTTDIDFKPNTTPLAERKPLILNYQQMRKNRIYHVGKKADNNKPLKFSMKEVLVGSYKAHLLVRPVNREIDGCSEFEAPSPHDSSKKEIFIHTCPFKKGDRLATEAESVVVQEGKSTNLKIRPFFKAGPQ